MKKSKKPVKLGSTQLDVLRSLTSHGAWNESCGWVWATNRETERYMARLVQLGLASRKAMKNAWGNQVWRYYPTQAGREYAEKNSRSSQ